MTTISSYESAISEEEILSPNNEIDFAGYVRDKQDFFDKVTFSKVNGEYIREFVDGITTVVSATTLPNARSVLNELKEASHDKHNIINCKPNARINLLRDDVEERKKFDSPYATSVGEIAEFSYEYEKDGFAYFDDIIFSISKEGTLKSEVTTEGVSLETDENGYTALRSTSVKETISADVMLSKIDDMSSSKDYITIQSLSESDRQQLLERMPTMEIPFDKIGIKDISENIDSVFYFDGVDGMELPYDATLDLSALSKEEQLEVEYELLKRSSYGKGVESTELNIESFEEFVKWHNAERVQLTVEPHLFEDEGIAVFITTKRDSYDRILKDVSLTDNETENLRELKQEISKELGREQKDGKDFDSIFE